MAVKHFIINPSINSVSKDVLGNIRAEGELLKREMDKVLRGRSKEKIEQEDDLVHVQGRVIVKVDMESKNSHRFSDGTTIRLERAFNNFNRRETQPINCMVISEENIPRGSEMLVDHNAFHETNRINDYKNSFEHEGSDDVRYFSIPLSECYAYRVKNGEWMPMPTFDFALRVFKPYEGLIQGVHPNIVKDVLYVTTGELKDKVVKTIKASDYVIIFQGDDGVEKQLLRFRPNGDEKLNFEPEAICVMDFMTEQVDKGELLVGLTTKDCEERRKFIHGD